MLLTKMVTVKWSPTNINHYKLFGYEYTKLYQEFEVKIEHLQKGSKVRVEIQCDYCQNIFTKTYLDYIYENEKAIIHKDCCKNCKSIKTKESNLLVYGVDNVNKLKEIGEKISNKNTKYNYDLIKCMFEEKGLILVSKSYNKIHDKLEYICPKHIQCGIQKITLADFINRDVGCIYCSLEIRSSKRRLGFKYVKDIFKSKDCLLLEDKYINTNTKMKYICLKHPDNIQENTLNTFIQVINPCLYCRLENNMSDLIKRLRWCLNNWKDKSKEFYNYQCVFTGSNKYEVHHLYSFTNIIMWALDNLGYKINNNYSIDQFINIKNKILEYHNNNLGICISKKIHILFHKLYKKYNNTPEQFEEFCQRYYNGEFDNDLNTRGALCQIIN